MKNRDEKDKYLYKPKSEEHTDVVWSKLFDAVEMLGFFVEFHCLLQ